MLTLAVLILLLAPVFKAARTNPNPKTIGLRNLTVALLVFGLLVSGGYAAGKELAHRDAQADKALCKP